MPLFGYSDADLERVRKMAKIAGRLQGYNEGFESGKRAGRIELQLEQMQKRLTAAEKKVQESS